MTFACTYGIEEIYINDSQLLYAYETSSVVYLVLKKDNELKQIIGTPYIDYDLLQTTPSITIAIAESYSVLLTRINSIGIELTNGIADELIINSQAVLKLLESSGGGTDIYFSEVESTHVDDDIIDVKIAMKDKILPVVGSGGTAPSFLTSPSISGNELVDNVLTCDPGTHAGDGPILVTYQWQNDSVDIGGATSSTYTPVAADMEHVITCDVTITNAYGTDSATSTNSKTIIYTFLDEYTGATCARSFRLLKGSFFSSTGVTIIRSSDSATENFGFIIDSGVAKIDTASMLTWAGASSAYITSFYDHTGNGRNWSQSVSASRPRIVNAGTLDVVGAYAAMYMDGSDDYLDMASGILTYLAAGSAHTIIEVLKSTSSATDQYSFAMCKTSTDRLALGVKTSTNEFSYTNRTASIVGKSKARVTTLSLLSTTQSAQHLYVDGVVDTGTSTINNGNATNVIYDGKNTVGSTNNFQGYKLVMIIYTDDRTSDIAAMNTRLKSLYGIT